MKRSKGKGEKVVEQEEAKDQVSRTDSRIFEEYKSIGYVSSDIPCNIRYIHTRKENFIVTCTGRSINTYVGQQLKLISTGGHSYERINCMTGDTYHVYTGVGNVIFAWRRGTEVKHVYKGHEYLVKMLLAYASELISVDESGVWIVWNIKTGEMKESAKFKIEMFNPSVLMHPLTYGNKIMFGSTQGMLQLWNMDTGSFIHHFDHWKPHRINAITQAPTVGVVGIAVSNKKIYMFNFEYDAIIMTLQCLDEPTSVCFRTDGITSLMAGSRIGSITMWDLEQQEEICYEKEAHHKAVSGLETFGGEPIMVSSSSDNSLKVWIFDKPDGGFRLLNSRDGHRLPPSMVGFIGEKELNIVSVGEDKCLRSFHIHNETYNRLINNYVPESDDVKRRGVPVNQFAIAGSANFCTWEDIACFDSSSGKSISTFSFENAKRGLDLKIPEFSQLEISSVCLTSCNQFAIVGFKTGELTLFNMQSKFKRISYGEHGKAHKRSITGIAVDSTNSVIVSGSLDGLIKFWHFGKGTLMETLECESPVQFMFFARTSNLFGVTLSDFNIWVCDISTFGIVRKLKGCSHPIRAAVFSPDCKWVTASTEDGCVRTWDVPTANLIDIFRVAGTIATALAYSPSGEFLASSMSGELGLVLWINKSVYQHVSLLPLPLDSQPKYISSEEDDKAEIVKIKIEDHDACLEDMHDNLTVMVKKHSARWRNLLKLDEIRLRNKPRTAPEKEMAPFMLSTTMTSIQNSIIPDPINEENGPPASKIKRVIPITHSSFTDQLCQMGRDPSRYEPLIAMLEEMGPSKVDMEIRALGPDGGGSVEILRLFLEFINQVIKSNGHFETSQAYLGLFLKVYGDIIPKHRPLVLALQELLPSVEVIEKRLTKRVINITALTDFAMSSLL